MNHTLLLLSALLLTPPASLPAAEPPAAPTPYVLHGKISDSADEPLEDVRVGF